MKKQSKSTWSFPIDLISEILLRLPVKSVTRFRCVSKLWSSITTDPCFIKSFETRSLTQPSLLLCVEKDDNLFVSSIPQHTHQNANMSYSSSQHIRTDYRMDFPGYFPRTESVHGLICYRSSGKPVVLNPSTRQFLTLPQPKISSRSRRYIVFFGYDPVEGKHKVVCVPYKKTCYVCRVFTLGSGQDSWRTVKTYHKHRAYSGTTGRCINGVIYYTARKRDETSGWVIMSFDVRSEKFHVIKGPSGIKYWDDLITYDGKLACAGAGFRNRTGLWILEDAEKDKWSSQDCLEPLRDWHLSVRRQAFDSSLFVLKGSTHAGEFIYVPIYGFHKFSFILFYDPVRNCCRRLQFEGIADDQSDQTRYTLNVFPNHIESLMSL